ncbi:MAG: polysaccharide biosynthesis/export family protein [Beijerinckiaceae bacterium]
MKRIVLTIGIAATLALGACERHLGTFRHSEAFMASLHEPYTLATGDRLRVLVFGQDSLSNTYAVDSHGHISMPLIGSVGALGQTTKSLENQIAARLRGGFLRDPKVSVEVEQYRPFFILGEVTSSGQYPFVNGMTIQTAVAIAGGFQPRADRHVATVTRQLQGEAVTGKVPLDTPVRPGDTITIRERFF